MKLLILILSILSLTPTLTYAVSAKKPKVMICIQEGYRFKKNALILINKSAPKPHLYLFYNRSKHKLWLNHPQDHPSASAGWSSSLGSKHWSALILTMKQFKFICQVSDSKGRFINKNCVKRLGVCEFSRVRITNPHLRGNSFWVAENLPLSRLLKKISHRGIEYIIDGANLKNKNITKK